MNSLAIYRKALEGSILRVDGGRPTMTSVSQSIQKKLKPQMGEMMSLPVRPLDAIQDIDPESETFGQFYFMVDVDPVDGDRLVM